MEELFKDLLEIDGITVVMFFSPKGEVLYKNSMLSLEEEPEDTAWWYVFVDQLDALRGGTIVFDQ